MSKNILANFQLLPFLPLRGVAVEIHGQMSLLDQVLQVAYEVKGDVEKLNLGSPTSSFERRDNLWQSTCFEFFLSESYTNSYWEINVSPEGHWNCYHFDNYRNGMKTESLAQVLLFETHRSNQSFRVEFAFPIEPLHTSRKIRTGNYDIAPAVVLEQKGGEKSYWTLTHAAAKPDFHRRAGFEIHLSTEK